jgi:hypothetical protein
MEILAIIGIIFLALIIFVGGGLFGWFLKGVGVVFSFFSEGWGTCLKSCLTIIWTIFVIVLIIYLLTS